MSEGAALEGLTVLAFESRRAAELAKLLAHHGATVLSAPSMREVPLGKKEELGGYVRTLQRGEIDVVVLLTGVGVRILLAEVRDEFPAESVAAALGKPVLVARGPKPVAALRELGLTPNFVVPPPFTWRELVTLLEEQRLIEGKTIALHEYGVPNQELLHALEARGGRVVRVPLYRWERPSDLAALRSGIAALLAGAVQAVVFTSANQVHSVFAFVQEEFPEASENWERQLRKTVVASVGPVCSAALRANQIEPDIEASPPKMGVLVHLLAVHGRSLWVRKAAESS